MSSRPHNKKRNTGVVYEQLLKSVSSSLVEGDKKRAQLFLNIIERHFRKGSELYNEFRLFNALVKCNASSSPVAAVIITEAKDAAKRADRQQLEQEKSRLIAEINRRVGPAFYDTYFENYRDYATIQVLLNSWRDNSTDISRVFEYEKKLVESMLRAPAQQASPELDVNPDVNSLVVNIMTEKLNKKFSSTMTSDQRDIIREYIFSPPGSDQTRLKETMFRVRRSAIADLDAYILSEKNDYIKERAGDVRSSLISLDADVIDDNTVIRFLTASKLSQEIREGDV